MPADKPCANPCSVFTNRTEAILGVASRSTPIALPQPRAYNALGNTALRLAAPPHGSPPFSGSGGRLRLAICKRAVCHSTSKVEIAMPDQPQPSASSNRFKAEMPQIPGVGAGPERQSGPRGGPWLVVGGLSAVLIAVFIGGRLLSKSHRSESPPVPAAQIDIPTDAPSAVPDLAVPTATEDNPVIARVGELAKGWDSRQFNFRNRATNENLPALLIRLPGRSSAQSAAGYWALVMKEAYGSCQLEYIQDLAKLRSDYSYRGASHPMLGNPCSRTVYDPLKYASLSGNVLARGAIVQGSDLRPPLGIEVTIKGNDIQAIRME